MASIFHWGGLVLVAFALCLLLRDDWLFIGRPLVRVEGDGVDARAREAAGQSHPRSVLGNAPHYLRCFTLQLELY